MGVSPLWFLSPVGSEVAGAFMRAAGGGAPGVTLSPSFAFGFFFFLVLREAEAGGVEERPREAEAEAEAIFCLALFPEGAGFLVFFVLGGMARRGKDRQAIRSVQKRLFKNALLNRKTVHERERCGNEGTTCSTAGVIPGLLVSHLLPRTHYLWQIAYPSTSLPALKMPLPTPPRPSPPPPRLYHVYGTLVPARILPWTRAW